MKIIIRLISQFCSFIFISICCADVLDLSSVKTALEILKKENQEVLSEYTANLKGRLTAAQNRNDLDACLSLKKELDEINSPTFLLPKFFDGNGDTAKRIAAGKIKKNQKKFETALEDINKDLIKEGRFDDAKNVRDYLKEQLDQKSTRVKYVTINGNTYKELESTLPKGVFNFKNYLWNVPSIDPIKHISPGGGGTIWAGWKFCVSKTPDNQTLVLSRFSDEKWLLSYNMQTEQFGDVFQVPDNNKYDAVSHVVSSKKPDNCYVGFGDGTVCEYSIKTGRILRRISSGEYIDEVLLNKNGDKLYFGGGNPKYWDLKTNRVITFGKYDANCFALNSDDSLLAVGTQEKGTIFIYNAKSRNEPIWIKALGKHLLSVKFTKDDKYILAGSDDPTGTVALYNIRTGVPRWSITGFECQVADAFFNANETLLFVVQTTWGWSGNPVIVFDTKSLLPVCQFPYGESCGSTNAILTADEKYVIPASCRSVKLFEIPSREAIDETIKQLKAVP